LIPRRSFLAAVATLLPTLHALAQAGTLRWVVPYPPGGGTDVLARTLAEAMRTGMGRTWPAPRPTAARCCRPTTR
jgi:tripartite-type tricarboxylate transporter receptor subunit TctC